MKLADKDIIARLVTFRDIGITDNPIKVVKAISEGNISPKLREALASGKIIIDPMPDIFKVLGSSTIDLQVGVTLEAINIPYEVVNIDGETVIRPFVVDCDPKHIERIRLHNKYGVTEIDQSWIRFTIKETDVFELAVGAQVNAFTQQIVCIPHDLEGKLDGRSRLARKGIATHITSDRFDAGFCGFITMEIQNSGQCNFNLRPGFQFCSLGFVQLSGKAEIPYHDKIGAKFSGQH